ncbi:hypothetical protein Phi46:1_gp52 [Cellulophaga phage phi46:1]|uniref:hypothetical protein n=1 Tax=Cellulophaga phage phi46:1 TaxID=1327974 RepID=UPI000351AC3D|nr:hypothetical protein Phi46:1_gp52 [Cellulophaga phage phi46:1]AGO47863.1 hypothetical protein Phi46:1_gp52 [Cellulophaga phage phi46:1]
MKTNSNKPKDGFKNINRDVAHQILLCLSAGFKQHEISSIINGMGLPQSSSSKVEKYVKILRKLNTCNTTPQLLYKFGANPRTIKYK